MIAGMEFLLLIDTREIHVLFLQIICRRESPLSERDVLLSFVVGHVDGSIIPDWFFLNSLLDWGLSSAIVENGDSNEEIGRNAQKDIGDESALLVLIMGQVSLRAHVKVQGSCHFPRAELPRQEYTSRAPWAFL